jgi:hypothetical protein
MLRTATLVSFLSGCAAASAGAVANVLVNTAVAATASAVSRSQGGCYAACPPGTRCAEATGLCETLPCRDLCGPDQMCEQTGAGDRCVPRAAIDMKLDLKPARITPQ